jgi:ketosteroid isomerase-like protein
MSQQDVEALRAVYERWGRGDLWTPEVFDPAVEVVWAADIPDTGTDHGLAGLTESTRRWLSAWEDLRVVAEEFVDLGERVLVLITLHGRGKDSGIQSEGRYAHVWTMRNGKAVRFEGYSDWDTARAAAGT